MKGAILEKLIQEIDDIEMQNKIMVEFIQRLIDDANGYWSKSAEQLMVAIKNRGNSVPTKEE